MHTPLNLQGKEGRKKKPKELSGVGRGRGELPKEEETVGRQKTKERPRGLEQREATERDQGELSRESPKGSQKL